MQGNFGIRELAEWAKREGAIDLAQGVIDASPPPALLTAYRELAIERASTYTNKRGVLEYREALREYLASRGWAVLLEQLAGTAGVMGATVAALLTELRPGDTVLLPEPFFIGHTLMLEALGFTVRYFPVPLDGPPDWEDLEKEMASAQALLLTTPANPTGQVAPAATLQRLSEAAAQHQCLLLLDEVYREFNWNEAVADDRAYASLDLSETVVMRSFSKTLAIPGWRAGFSVTTPKRVEKMAAYHDALYIGGSAPAQYALAVALARNREALNQYVATLRQTLKANQQIFAAAFAASNMQPLPVPGAYYMLIAHNRESDMAAMEELMAKKIAVVPVSILLSQRQKSTGYIRAHFGVRPETALRLQQALT